MLDEAQRRGVAAVDGPRQDESARRRQARPPFALLGLGRPFMFPTEVGMIQFASGMLLLADDATLLISFGEQDCEARRATLPLAAGRRWAEQSQARKTNVGHASLTSMGTRRGGHGGDAQRMLLTAARLDPNVTGPVAADRRLYVAGASWFYDLCMRHAVKPQHADRQALATSLALDDALLYRAAGSNSIARKNNGGQL